MAKGPGSAGVPSAFGAVVSTAKGAGRPRPQALQNVVLVDALSWRSTMQTITELKAWRVAAPDGCALANRDGGHEPYFRRTVVVAKENQDRIGLAEIPGIQGMDGFSRLGFRRRSWAAP